MSNVRRTQHTYAGSKDVGAWAVKIIAEHFQNEGNVVIDVQDDLFFRGMDVDLLKGSPADNINLVPAGLLEWVEVKADRYISDNVYLETASNLQKGTPGCMVYTQADTLVYYMVNLGVAYVFVVPDLQEWMKSNLSRFQKHTIANYTNARNYAYSSEGHTVPVAVLQKELGSAGQVKLIDGLAIYEVPTK